MESGDAIDFTETAHLIDSGSPTEDGVEEIQREVNEPEDTSPNENLEDEMARSATDRRGCPRGVPTLCQEDDIPVSPDSAAYAEEKLAQFDYDPIDSSIAVSEGYPSLDYKPFQLKSWFLILTLVFFSLCLASIEWVISWTHRLNGAQNHSRHISSPQMHLAFRYVPPLVGTITSIWWRAINQNLGRFTPYISLAAKRGGQRKSCETKRSHRRTLQINYGVRGDDPVDLWESFWESASNGHWLFFLSMVVQLMFLFLVPFKAVLIQIVEVQDGWIITISSRVGYILIAMYSIAIGCTLLTLLRLRKRETGLKWDPSSIVDQITLYQGSNALETFNGLEGCLRPRFEHLIGDRASRLGSSRLGYWRHRQKQHHIWYGIATFKDSLVKSSNKQRRNEEHPDEVQQRDGEQQRDEELPDDPSHDLIEADPSSPAESEIHSIWTHSDQNKRRLSLRPAYLRYFLTKFPLGDIELAIFALMALGLITATVVGLAKYSLLHGVDFRPLTLCHPAPGSCFFQFQGRPEDVTYHFQTVLVFRFIPVVLFNLFGQLWVMADQFYRTMQAFAGMDTAAPATSNILLRYPSAMPGIITAEAVSNGHWRVAIMSVYSLCARAPPYIFLQYLMHDQLQHTDSLVTHQVSQMSSATAMRAESWTRESSIPLCYPSKIPQMKEFIFIQRSTLLKKSTNSGITKVETAECISALMLLRDKMKRVRSNP